MAEALGRAEAPVQVVVTDVRMPFGSMVLFLVKWSLAAIPAILILVVTVVLVGAFVRGLVGL